MILQIRVSLEGVRINRNEDTFWTSLGDTLRRNYTEIQDIRSSTNFLNAFNTNVWREQKIVIFIDEFDKVYDATDNVRNEFLETLREIRNNNHLYAAHSVVACGTLSIRHLNSTNVSLSPFNVAESLKNPYFSLQQTRCLFDEYAQDAEITIDHDIVNDIHTKSNGYVLHPNWYCLSQNLANMIFVIHVLIGILAWFAFVDAPSLRIF